MNEGIMYRFYIFTRAVGGKNVQFWTFLSSEFSSLESVIAHPEVSGIYSWNSNITSCFRRGDFESAERIFAAMPERNLVTWNCMISGYIKNKKLREARVIFDSMPRKNVVSWTALLNGYAKCGRLSAALDLFSQMPQKNIICWNTMISGYVKNGKIKEARDIFDMMPKRNLISWASMIGGYLKHENVAEAKNLFLLSPEHNVSLANVMLSGYVELGYFRDAFELFDGMADRDVASWTIMMTCYMNCGDMDKARSIFEKMPNKDAPAWTAIIRGCIRNGQIKVAQELFNKIPQRDTMAYNSMISGYIQNGMLEDALKLFRQMPEKDIVSWNSILHGYVQEGDMASACHLFDRMPERDVISCNTLISGYQCWKALSLFSRMISDGFKPDQCTYTILLSVCGDLACLGWGKKVHLQTIKICYEHDALVLSSLITMYSKCGALSDALLIFKQTVMRRDRVIWNSMIAAHAYHGSAEEAFQIFLSMKEHGIYPNHVTFLSLLSSCGHSGLVEEGWKHFKSMCEDWKLIPKPEHYACMVDLLGRSGRFGEAIDFIRKIPEGLLTTEWETLLSAWRIHGNMNLECLASLKSLNSQPSDAGVHVLVSNIYAASGMWRDAANVRQLMRENETSKQPGCSWTEINGEINAFFYDDRSHPLTEDIYVQLHLLALNIEDVGFLQENRCS